MHTLPASKSHRLFKYKQFPFFRTIACVYVYVYAQFQPELDFLQVAALSLHVTVLYVHVRNNTVVATSKSLHFFLSNSSAL
jgi:hypothetical protein